MGDTDSCSSKQSEYSPVISRKRLDKIQVFYEVLQKLRELNVEESAEPAFEDELWSHFTMLPHRYALDVNTERAEDVLMHRRLLSMAHDSLTRPAVDVRLVQARQTCDVTPGNSVHSGSNEGIDSPMPDSLELPPAFGKWSKYDIKLEVNSSDENGLNNSMTMIMRPLHEITISTKDKPKLLSGLTLLMSEIGLNIQEAHAFCTNDGYSLDIFVVDGWEKGIVHLKNLLVREILKVERETVTKPGQEPNDTFLPLSPVDIPFDGSDVWEIDSSLLNVEYKLTSASNGNLYKGSFRSQDVAIKVFKADNLNGHLIQEFSQEVYILRKVRHKNVVQFIGACTKPPLLCIVTEFMSGGSVYDFLHKRKGVFKLPAIIKVAVDVSKGMSYLHQNNIIHRDLKAANILIDENEVVKIADFGVARVRLPSGVMTAETGTYRWMAPEVIEHKPYNHKADVFSFGIVLWELLTGKLPYANMTPLQAAVGVVQKSLRPTTPRNAHPLLLDLLEKCWHQEPSSRPEFSEIVETLQSMAKIIVEDERAGKKRNLGESHQPVDERSLHIQENRSAG